MGDTRLKDKPDEKKTQGQEDPSAGLRDNAYQAMKGAGSDRTGNQTSAKPKFDNPFDHIALAGAALREIDSLKDLPPKDKVQVADNKGAVREVTVEQRRAELIKAAEQQFTAGINAADRIDQNKVSLTVITLKEKIAKETDPAEKKKLEEYAYVVDSMKHAPGVTRFAYASFLADEGDFVKAKKLLDEVKKVDGEGKLDPTFVKLSEKVENELKARENMITEGNNPLVALNSAIEKRNAGDAAGAEAEYKKAIELAGKIDPKVVEQNLKTIEQLKAANPNNADALKELEQQKQAWTAIANSGSIAAVNYADFLVEKARYKEAKELLVSVGHNNPELVKGDKQFAELLQKARDEGKKPEPFDNPFVHLSNVQELAKKEDMQGVKRELEAAVKAAEKIDRKMMQDNKKVVEEQLKEERDPERRKALEQLRDTYDQMDHALAFTRTCLARFELANKNYSRAQQLLGQVESQDWSFTRKPEIKFDELKEGSKEPSTWSKIWSGTKAVLKELVCDGVAILAGAGAVLLTGWSGPAALVAGGCAGAAAYTGMKTLVFGDKFSWDMPLWGAVDGVTGGTAALARTALCRVGGQIVTKEVAANMATKTGVDLAKITAKEGTMAYGKAVEQLGKEGLKQLAKKENLSLWTRMTSHVPLTGAFLGNAEYRAGVNALRGVTARNVAANAFVDGGTALAGSMVYRGVHDGVDYKNGKYQNFGDFASNYSKHVLFDTTKGAGVGAFSTSFGYGSLTSLGLNGGREYLTGSNKNFSEWAGKTAFGTMNDMILGTPSTFLLHGRLGGALERFPGTNFMSSLQGSYIAGTPQFYEAWQAKVQADEIEKGLAEMQKQPETADELQRRYFSLPGTDEYPTAPPKEDEKK